jgi:hypothetical protein
MKITHTPGPWTVKQENDVRHFRITGGLTRVVKDWQTRTGIDAAPFDTATVAEGGIHINGSGDMAGHVGLHELIDAEELQANARLITKAPELVALLDKWTHEGHLQSFEDRERFRKEAAALIREIDGVTP